MGIKKQYESTTSEILARADLSWKAKGIMAYLLTLTEEEQNDIITIRNQATEGISAFRSGWKELEDAGYVKRFPVMEKGRTVEWRTKVHISR